MKGSLDDINYIVTAGWAVAFFFLLFAVLITSFSSTLNANPAVDATTKTAIGTFSTSTIAILFNAIPLIIFGLYFVALMLATRVQNNPAYIVFSLIIAGVSIILAGVFGFAFEQLAAKPQFAAVLVGYPQVTFIFENYAALITVMVILMFIVLYSKLVPGQGVGYR